MQLYCLIIILMKAVLLYHTRDILQHKQCVCVCANCSLRGANFEEVNYKKDL